MESSKEQLYKHYESLRNEIVEADKLNYQIMVLLFTSSGAILSYSINKENYYIGVLLIYLIAFLGYRLLLGNRRRIWRISTYLATYIEPELENIFWERGLNEMGLNKKNKLSSLIRSNEVFVINSVCILAFLLVLLKYFFDSGNNNNSALTIVIIAFVATILMLIWSISMFLSNNRNGVIHKKMIDEWLKIKTEFIKSDSKAN